MRAVLAAVSLVGAATSGATAQVAQGARLEPLSPSMSSTDRASVLAHRLLGEVADQIVETRYEPPGPDRPAAVALYGRPRSSSIPGLCEVRVIHVFDNDWRTGLIASNTLNLGGRAILAETRYRPLRPFWFGPPGNTNIPELDANILSDDKVCSQAGSVERYFRSRDAGWAVEASSMFWDVGRWARSNEKAPFKVLCMRKVPACEAPLQALAALTADDIVSVDQETCPAGSDSTAAKCFLLEVDKRDTCGNPWVVDVEGTNRANGLVRVKLDPDPCGESAAR